MIEMLNVECREICCLQGLALPFGYRVVSGDINTVTVQNFRFFS